MKRSEMVQVIQDYFNFHGLDDTGGICSDVLLKKIEQAGMEPPKIVATSIFQDATEYGMTNEWEDE